MAHLLNNPFQAPFEFPRPGPLLTPPDTESEYQGQPPARSRPAPMGLGIELDQPPSHRSASLTEVPISRKLQYIHSGPREARERVVQRSVRWLVVVTPPMSFADEHGHFGHTLSVGSPQRLSQGVLMPLFPTMSSQLTAIAREFAFPSTSGLCLYLHTSHGGFTMSPRVTDESWPVLWAHLFEPRSPTVPPSQLPIGGSIEFDIDISKARWYEAWIGFGRRDLVDVPVSVSPSRRGSVTHAREDSRTTMLDDQGDEQLESLPPSRPSRTPGHRHIPRKLSLLDRLESSSVRSGSKLVPRNQSPPSPILFTDARRTPFANGLSPVVQESEPRSGKRDIDTFVNSWRASASLAPSPLNATGQTSLDPANIPNDKPLLESSSGDADAESELDLNDFQWSVSSAGPGDYEYAQDDFEDSQSLESWRLPSVHVDRRAEGSVCLTPTTCTSFGPPDWDASPVPDAEFLTRSLAALLPSPDLASRMLEDCPPTPSTATSWGPPQSYPASPSRSEQSYAPSVDLGQRCMSAVPLTPTTATSWGPPSSWPATPATPYHVHTPDIGQRSFDLAAPRLQPVSRDPPQSIEAQERDNEPWKNVWPYIGTAALSSAVASSSMSPYTFVFPQRPASPPSETAEDAAIAQPAPSLTSQGLFSFGWPFFDASNDAPIIAVQPPPEHDVGPHELETEDQHTPVRVRKLSPFRFIFEEPAQQNPPAEPLAPAEGPWDQVATHEAQVSENSNNGPWILVWPYLADQADNNTTPIVNYPFFDIYPAVYPHFNLYPAPAGVVSSNVSQELSVYLEPSYPVVQPYRPQYPFLEIYPAVSAQNNGFFAEPPVISLHLPAYYPALALYAPVYPWNVYNIYPSDAAAAAEPKVPSLQLPVSYPTLNIYSPVYPHNLDVIYPPVAIDTADAIGPTVISPRLSTVYPNVELYPAVYPYNLDSLYPSVSVCQVQKSSEISIRLSSVYPSLSIYRPVYPHNVMEIYPTVEVDDQQRHDDKSVTVRLSAYYPNLEIYSVGYPWNLANIYPSVAAESDYYNHLSVELPTQYPTVQPYDLVYPFNVESIYPSVTPVQSPLQAAAPASKSRSPLPPVPRVLKSHGHHVKRSSSTSKLPVPPVPPLPQDVSALRPIHPTSHRPLDERVGISLPVRLPKTYPHICPYPPAYPYFDLYPEGKAETFVVEPLSIRLECRYPAIEIYAPVYPFIEPYPQKAADSIGSLDISNSQASASAPCKLNEPHLQLHEQVLSSQAVDAAIFAPRQRPKHTHLELHARVVNFMTPSPPTSPLSPRKLPTPPLIRVPEFTQNTQPSTPPQASPNVSPAPSPSRRSRSGTVSSRPPLPTPPVFLGSTTLLPVLQQQPESPPKPVRRLPTIPSDTPSSPSAPRPQIPRGLPSSPAAGRRASALPPLSRSSSTTSSFSPLASVPEPDAVSTSTYSSPSASPSSPFVRPLPRPQLSPTTLDVPGLQRSVSSRLPSAPQPNVAPDLSRRKSLPPRPLPRARSGTVAAPPAGFVAGLTKAYNSTPAVDESLPPFSENMSSTLAQFPTPPRPPLPPVPNSRPVSKLDRSKYPFN